MLGDITIVENLQNQVNNLTEIILILRKEKFGSRSEKTSSQIECQLSLFNEAEAENFSNPEEPLIIRKGSVYKKHKSTREELLKDIPVEEVPSGVVIIGKDYANDNWQGLCKS